MPPEPVAPPQADTQLGGLLGAALQASRQGRLLRFIVDEASPAIALFDPALAEHNTEGDWYGEHAGKWLIAAARAAASTQDAVLTAQVRRVASHLVALQRPDGYLGTYAPGRRFTVRPRPRPGTTPGDAALPSWDGAPALRAWDIWTHAYLILGLLEVHKQLAQPGCLAAACRIGDLCWHTLMRVGIDITELGNHHGLSASVLMDPAMELHFATGEQRYLELALRVLQQADAQPDLALLRRGLAGADVAEIATGKAYQLCWNLVGLAKIHRATGSPEHARVLDKLWHSIRDHHLTLGGGPWGGVAHRSREVFNAPGSFSPHAYVETCSTLAWIQLNGELLQATGQARYGEEIERAAYNALLGAMAANGEDWCYYTFANGRRVHTTYWRCCKSSGAMALEELPALACTVDPAGGLRLNLLGPGRSGVTLAVAGPVTLEQRTGYPFDGAVDLHVTPAQAARFEIGLRIPAWATGAALAINGQPVAAPVVPGTHFLMDRCWQPGDVVSLRLPMPPIVRHKLLQNIQESRLPDGSPVRQEVLRHEYVAVTRGPLVYASGLVDGYKTEETVRLPDAPVDQWLQVLQAAPEGPTIRFAPEGRAPMLLHPYYRADGRHDGGWRLTWFSLAPAGQAGV